MLLGDRLMGSFMHARKWLKPNGRQHSQDQNCFSLPRPFLLLVDLKFFCDFPVQVWCFRPAPISIWLPSVTSSSTPNITRELVSGLTYAHTHTHNHKSMHEDANTLTACICSEACFLPAAKPSASVHSSSDSFRAVQALTYVEGEYLWNSTILQAWQNVFYCFKSIFYKSCWKDKGPGDWLDCSRHNKTFNSNVELSSETLKLQ